MALPLISLAYHEVKINMTFRSLSSLVVGTLTGTPSLSYASLWVDYVFLDVDERTAFAQNPQEYLIDQL